MEHRSLAPDLIVSDNDDPSGNQLSGKPASDVAQKKLLKEKQMGRAVNCSDLELSTYLQALAAGYLPTFYSDTSPSVPSKSMSIASKSFQRGKQTVVFHGFPSLQMFKNSTGNHGKDLLTWFAGDFLARTSAAQGKAKELMENAAECGDTWPASLAKYDPDSCSWKTAQCLLLGGLAEFSETWPRWGLMRNGECWERTTPDLRTCGKDYGLWPTPCSTDQSDRKVSARMHETKNGTFKHIGENGTLSQVRLSQVVKHRTPDGVGRMSPDWVEWLMGWPIGHTELKPLATAKYQEWQLQHSPC